MKNGGLKRIGRQKSKTQNKKYIFKKKKEYEEEENQKEIKTNKNQLLRNSNIYLMFCVCRKKCDKKQKDQKRETKEK